MILALESSCDETAVAVFDPMRGLTGEWVHSQIALHERHGGVVPDLATREHLRHFGPLLARARATADFSKLSHIAVTRGPGLAACLAIGVAAAKALGISLRIPVVGVNHLRGHVWSPFLPVHAEAPEGFRNRLRELMPHLGLIVSGGNTLLFSVNEDLRVHVIASTRDDAAGEALDKGAKLLGLGYPGGPLVERLAAGGRTDAFDFPRGIGRRDELDFSFSGLKTSLRYQLEKMSTVEVEARRNDLCASYQQAVIDVLVRKTGLAFERDEAGFRSIGLSGGVANNRALRARLQTLAEGKGVSFLAAKPEHTGDNAGMIAFAAWIEQLGEAGVSGMDLTIDPALALAAQV
jgi:N6-L-threonylcarbamoyladenine synthase